jgi:DedD protein
MSTAQKDKNKDTEITLGTGHMLAIFFILVLICAVFFAMGFSLGRRTALAGVVNPISSPVGISASTVRPSAAKTDASQPQSSDFSFYKAVGEKNADGALPPQNSKSAPEAASSNTGAPAADASVGTTPKSASDAASAPPAGGSYYVQVAAVSRPEDAEALVEALKKKQYPAFTASSTAGDKLFHVQVGPYAEVKDAEAMRARLISDGYNPIVKK